MWLVNGLREAFSYVGWLVGFLRYAPIWPGQESGVKLRDQCTHCMYLVSEAHGAFDYVGW